jgi:ketosteroid isomerase-like protein
MTTRATTTLDERSAESVVREFWRLYSATDLSSAVQLFADDCVLALYIPEHVLPFGGETKGKAAASDRLAMIKQQFELLKYVGEVKRVVDDTVHAMVNFHFRHRVTGEDIEGSLRIVVVVRDGLIVRADEYHDVERIRAFMRLVAYVAHER